MVGGFEFPAENERQARINMGYIAIACGLIRQKKIGNLPYELIRKAVGRVLVDCGEYLKLEEMGRINQELSGLTEVLGEFI